MNSTFKSDLEKENRLSIFLDEQYKNRNIFPDGFNVVRIDNLDEQHKGIDLKVILEDSGKEIYIDEKAQLDYINKVLPTFAFEISYFINEKWHQGWLFDSTKKTHKYFLVTCIEEDADGFCGCRVVSVNRKDLCDFLDKEKGLSFNRIYEYEKKFRDNDLDGKIFIKELKGREEGRFHYSNSNKKERPINLVLNLDFLINQGLAKELLPCRINH